MVKITDHSSTDSDLMSTDDSLPVGDGGFGERLSHEIGARGDKPAAAARKMGVSKQSLDQWIKGRSVPRADVAVRICERYGMDLHYLVTGEFAPAVDTEMVLVPKFEVRASAGPGRAVVPDDVEGPSERLAFSRDWLRRLGIDPDHAELLVASGDSMEPLIRDGDVMLMNRRIRTVETAGIYVVTIAGMVVVKRAFIRPDGSLVLKSENPIYPEETVEPEDLHAVTIEGRIRWAGRSM